MAINEGNVEKVKEILDKDDSKLSEPPVIEPVTLSNSLKLAISKHQNDIVNEILLKMQSTIQPMMPNKFKEIMTESLEISIISKNILAVRLMLEAGADTMFQPGQNALNVLLEGSCPVNDDKLNYVNQDDFYIQCLRILIKNGADINFGRHEKPLMSACRIGHPLLIQELLQNDAISCHTPHDQHMRGEVETLIMENSDDERVIKCLEVLVSFLGVDFETLMNSPMRQEYYEAPMLYFAIKYTRPNLVKFFLENGAALKILSDCSQFTLLSPLAHALESLAYLKSSLFENGHYNMTDTEKWIDEEEKRSVILDKTIHETLKVVSLLVEYGADINKCQDFVANYCYAFYPIRLEQMTPIEYCLRKHLPLQNILFNPQTSSILTQRRCVSLAFSKYGISLPMFEKMLENGFNANINLSSYYKNGIFLAFGCWSKCASESRCKRDSFIFTGSDYLEDPMNTKVGCESARVLKLLIKHGAQLTIEDGQYLVMNMLKDRGNASSEEALIDVAACCLSKINVLEAAGLLKRSVYIEAINFYLRRFNLEDYRDVTPQSLRKQSRHVIMRTLKKRDRRTFECLSLPQCFEREMTLKSYDCPESSLLTVQMFLHRFSSAQRKERFEESPYYDSFECPQYPYDEHLDVQNIYWVHPQYRKNYFGLNNDLDRYLLLRFLRT